MSRELIVINIGGQEFIGEQPQKWPPEKGTEFTFRDVMLLHHQVMGTEQGPARVIFLHPVSDYHVKSFQGWRSALDKERNIYNQEKDANRLVKPVSVTPERLEELRKRLPPEQFEALLKGMAGQPKPEGGIVTP